MNSNSKILKLSIIFMLILVLIPVASAMDSSEAFYEEYEVQECEEVVEEYNSYQVEDTQVDVSSDSNYPIDENQDELFDQNQNHADENGPDTVEIPELNVDSVDVTQNIIKNTDEIHVSELDSQNVDEIVDNINETCDDELTLEMYSVNYQGSIFISKYDTTVNNLFIINQILYTGMTVGKVTNLNRNLLKVLELKNNLLIKQDIQTFLDENEIDDIDDVIVCISNTHSDFIYSIDNSIIGERAVIFIAKSCFLNFYPCFDAFSCCRFLDVEYFFSCGDFFMKCCGFFCKRVVEFSEYNLLLNIEPESGVNW